jgi:hypothetical protein
LCNRRRSREPSATVDPAGSSGAPRRRWGSNSLTISMTTTFHATSLQCRSRPRPDAFDAARQREWLAPLRMVSKFSAPWRISGSKLLRRRPGCRRGPGLRRAEVRSPGGRRSRFANATHSTGGAGLVGDRQEVWRKRAHPTTSSKSDGRRNSRRSLRCAHARGRGARLPVPRCWALSVVPGVAARG